MIPTQSPTPQPGDLIGQHVFIHEHGQSTVETLFWPDEGGAERYLTKAAIAAGHSYEAVSETYEQARCEHLTAVKMALIAHGACPAHLLPGLAVARGKAP